MITLIMKIILLMYNNIRLTTYQNSETMLATIK
jgi:hypothetical protein